MVILTFIGVIWLIVIVGNIVMAVRPSRSQTRSSQTKIRQLNHRNHCSSITMPQINHENSIDMSNNTIFTDIDSNSTNPTTGLPMIDGCIDVSGTPLGLSDDTFSHDHSFSSIDTSGDMFS